MQGPLLSYIFLLIVTTYEYLLTRYIIQIFLNLGSLYLASTFFTDSSLTSSLNSITDSSWLPARLTDQSHTRYASRSFFMYYLPLLALLSGSNRLLD